MEVAQHEMETAEALLSSVDDHVKAGLAVESDRMSAQVNEAARKQGLIAAQGDLDLAWAQLRVAMGAPDLQQSKLQPIEPEAAFRRMPSNRNWRPPQRPGPILPRWARRSRRRPWR